MVQIDWKREDKTEVLGTFRLVGIAVGDEIHAVVPGEPDIMLRVVSVRHIVRPGDAMTLGKTVATCVALG